MSTKFTKKKSVVLLFIITLCIGFVAMQTAKSPVPDGTVLEPIVFFFEDEGHTQRAMIKGTSTMVTLTKPEGYNGKLPDHWVVRNGKPEAVYLKE